MKYNVIAFFVYFIFILINISHVVCKTMVPVLVLLEDTPTPLTETVGDPENKTHAQLKYFPFISLIDKDKDTSEYWRETEILSLVRNNEIGIDYERCERDALENRVVQINSPRTVRPICKNRIELLPQRRSLDEPCSCDKFRPDIFKVNNRTFIHHHRCPCFTRRRFEISRYYKSFKTRNNLNSRRVFPTTTSDDDFDNYQLCPQCPHFNNHTECELFRDSCKESRVNPADYRQYCDRKYGKWRAMFVPADYSQCRCCDECIFFRELDQSCVEDEYSLVTEEFLPTTTIDFRAGCNQYWGHPEQEFRALRCDKMLRRCVPVSVPQLPKGSFPIRRSFRYEIATNEDCPVSCLGYECKAGRVQEKDCSLGGFIPDKDQCNCCGKCSVYQQLNEKCAEFKKTFQKVNGSVEIEVEEEFLEPGCDDGLVCRQGRCQDIHAVPPAVGSRRKRDETEGQANEPCKRELKYFKKKFGADGHLHYNAPQCTPLWLYAPVQCRRFVCYCALEDGSFILGIKVPRVEVSNMNCDCAREKCRTGTDVECDGYGNYKEAVFTPHLEDWQTEAEKNQGSLSGVKSELGLPYYVTEFRNAFYPRPQIKYSKVTSTTMAPEMPTRTRTTSVPNSGSEPRTQIIDMND